MLAIASISTSVDGEARAATPMPVRHGRDSLKKPVRIGAIVSISSVNFISANFI
jgi:hypothetical protein